MHISLDLLNTLLHTHTAFSKTLYTLYQAELVTDIQSFSGQLIAKSHYHLICLCFWMWKTRKVMTTLRICTRTNGPGLRKKERRLNIQCLSACTAAAFSEV